MGVSWKKGYKWRKKQVQLNTLGTTPTQPWKELFTAALLPIKLRVMWYVICLPSTFHPPPSSLLPHSLSIPALAQIHGLSWGPSLQAALSVLQAAFSQCRRPDQHAFQGLLDCRADFLAPLPLFAWLLCTSSREWISIRIPIHTELPTFPPYLWVILHPLPHFPSSFSFSPHSSISPFLIDKFQKKVCESLLVGRITSVSRRNKSSFAGQNNTCHCSNTPKTPQCISIRYNFAKYFWTCLHLKPDTAKKIVQTSLPMLLRVCEVGKVFYHDSVTKETLCLTYVS